MRCWILLYTCTRGGRKYSLIKTIPIISVNACILILISYFIAKLHSTSSYTNVVGSTVNTLMTYIEGLAKVVSYLISCQSPCVIHYVISQLIFIPLTSCVRIENKAFKSSQVLNMTDKNDNMVIQKHHVQCYNNYSIISLHV